MDCKVNNKANINTLKVACFGDVCGEIGRNVLIEYLNNNKHLFDFIIVNGENSAHGFGITQKIYDQFIEAGVDVVTLGNHSFDQKNDLQIFDRNPNLIRPLNYPKGTIGHGYTVVNRKGLNIMVINLIGRTFMEYNDDPFYTINEFLNINKLGVKIDAIFIDFHAEVSSEKLAMAHYLDGRISGLFGTHTHVPTADAQILANGTGFISDCGMCGDYKSVIGMDITAPIMRFTSKINAHAKFIPANDKNSAYACGVVFEINRNGKCVNITPIRSGGEYLKEQKPFK